LNKVGFSFLVLGALCSCTRQAPVDQTAVAAIPASVMASKSVPTLAPAPSAPPTAAVAPIIVDKNAPDLSGISYEQALIKLAVMANDKKRTLYFFRWINQHAGQFSHQQAAKLAYVAAQEAIPEENYPFPEGESAAND
jgi:hypothetical protein